jgi:hypothetical protein
VVGNEESERSGRSYRGKKKKVVCAVQPSEAGKVKRFYAQQIRDFSAKSLDTLVERHILKEAQVTTDEWRGYRPLNGDFKIEQIPSEPGMNFKAIHTLIHQVKSC